MRDEVVSIDEVARRLDIPKATLYSRRYKGTSLPSHRVRKHVQHRWSDVLEWMDGLE